VLAADAVGAMYGGLDVAEAMRLGTLAGLRDSDHSPRIGQRGIKFNIPLDARTPSYSDNSDAAQANIPEMWSCDFWRAFLDEMAAPPLQCPLALEPPSISVAGQGAEFPTWRLLT